jgi:hypothetical protein
LALAGAACGRSSPPTLAAWVERADNICRSAQDELDRQPPSQSPFPGEPLRAAADATSAELSSLTTIRKPDERKGEVEDYLVSVRLRTAELVDYAAKIDAAPVAGDPVPIDRLLELTGKANDQAQSLGLQICGAGVDPSVGFGPSASTTTTAPSPAVGEAPGPADEFTTVDESG